WVRTAPPCRGSTCACVHRPSARRWRAPSRPPLHTSGQECRSRQRGGRRRSGARRPWRDESSTWHGRSAAGRPTSRQNRNNRAFLCSIAARDTAAIQACFAEALLSPPPSPFATFAIASAGRLLPLPAFAIASAGRLLPLPAFSVASAG